MSTVEHCSLAASDLGVRGLFCWRNGPKSDRSLILSLYPSLSLTQGGRSFVSEEGFLKGRRNASTWAAKKCMCEPNNRRGALLSRSYMQCPYAFLARDDATSLCT